MRHLDFVLVALVAGIAGYHVAGFVVVVHVAEVGV